MSDPGAHGSAPLLPSWWAAVDAGLARGQEIGAVGPGDRTRHYWHGAALADFVVETGIIVPAPATGPPVSPAHPTADVRAVDLGTGVGLPGLVLAGLLPHVHWTLVDAAARRIRVVAETVEALGWSSRVEVVHGRAEDLGRDDAFRGRGRLVVARSFGSPATTAECAAPLIALGGSLVVTEPPVPDGDRWSEDGLAVLGLAIGRRHTDPSFQCLVRIGDLADRFPRRPGVAERRPLW